VTLLSAELLLLKKESNRSASLPILRDGASTISDLLQERTKCRDEAFRLQAGAFRITMVFELTDFNANNPVAGEARGYTREIIKRQATRDAVVGRHDSRIQDVAVQMEIDWSIRDEAVEFAEHLGTGRESDHASVDDFLLCGVQIAGLSQNNVLGVETPSEAGVPSAE
jgi:hypothetical protein